MKILNLLNLLSFILVVTVNALANILPINGLSTGEISDGFKSLFAPAGYVFSIWGLIYLLLGAFTVYQLLPQQKDNQRILHISPWFIAANIVNSFWIVGWHYLQFPLTLVLIIALLVSLIFIYLILRKEKGQSSLKERIFLELPFSVYLGWASVATIANVAVVLIDGNWNGFGINADLWTVIMIVIAGILGLIMIFQHREIAYPLVLVWAISGITQNGLVNNLITTVAWFVVGILAAGILISQILLRRKAFQPAK